MAPPPNLSAFIDTHTFANFLGNAQKAGKKGSGLTFKSMSENFFRPFLPEPFIISIKTHLAVINLVRAQK